MKTKDLNIKDDEHYSNKTFVLENLSEAVNELNLVNKGKLKTRNAEELIDILKSIK